MKGFSPARVQGNAMGSAPVWERENARAPEATIMVVFAKATGCVMVLLNAQVKVLVMASVLVIQLLKKLEYVRELPNAKERAHAMVTAPVRDLVLAGRSE